MWQECVVTFYTEEHMNGDYRFSSALMCEECIIQVSPGILQPELLLRKSWVTVIAQLLSLCRQSPPNLLFVVQ